MTDWFIILIIQSNNNIKVYINILKVAFRQRDKHK